MIQSGVFWLVLLCSSVLYWLFPKRIRVGFLALVSYGYLVTLEPVAVNVLLGVALVFFYVAPHAAASEKKRPYVLWGLGLAVIGYLVYEKYLPSVVTYLQTGEAAGRIVVPLGISYFTFKLLHYAVEVANGNITDRSLQRFFCYVFLFPIFTAGPIERFDHFLDNSEDEWRLETAVEGVTRIVHGLIKLFVLAHLVRPANWLPEHPDAQALVNGLDTAGAPQVWAFLALSFLYAYFDFAAYSDIAIGASRLFGFRIMENFNLPILAPNLGDFWRRWHMSLVEWCRAYVYMPVIARTRKPYAAVFATFVAIGIWHGGSLNWLCWGLYHASGVATFLTWGRIKRKKGWLASPGIAARALGVAVTFAFVSGSYAFSTTVNQGAGAAFRVFAKAFGIEI